MNGQRIEEYGLRESCGKQRRPVDTKVVIKGTKLHLYFCVLLISVAILEFSKHQFVCSTTGAELHAVKREQEAPAAPSVWEFGEVRIEGWNLKMFGVPHPDCGEQMKKSADLGGMCATDKDAVFVTGDSSIADFKLKTRQFPYHIVFMDNSSYAGPSEKYAIVKDWGSHCSRIGAPELSQAVIRYLRRISPNKNERIDESSEVEWLIRHVQCRCETHPQRHRLLISDCVTPTTRNSNQTSSTTSGGISFLQSTAYYAAVGQPVPSMPMQHPMYPQPQYAAAPYNFPGHFATVVYPPPQQQQQQKQTQTVSAGSIEMPQSKVTAPLNQQKSTPAIRPLYGGQQPSQTATAPMMPFGLSPFGTSTTSGWASTSNMPVPTGAYWGMDQQRFDASDATAMELDFATCSPWEIHNLISIIQDALKITKQQFL